MTLRLTLSWVLLLAAGCRQGGGSVVNFAHLEHLTERIELGTQRVSIVHIYANAPEYAWVDAKESGPEGIACVDDAARAAVVYLRDYELNGHRKSLEASRGLLDFLLAMQAEDGEFYNFIHADHSINRDGKTSYKSFGWWASRGVWALALGCRVFREADPAYAALLQSAVGRSLRHVDTLLKAYGVTEKVGGFVTPTWLLYRSGADATSELMLGLLEYYKAHPSPELREAIERLASGFVMMQEGDAAAFPYGLHRSWGTLWHLWGNGQTQALGEAGRVLGDSAMIASARREALGFYTRLIIGPLLREMDLAAPGERKEFDQIAYGIRPMTVGLLRLYDATGESNYLTLAGLAASWLFGNNPAGIAMYDTATGRCFDGVRSATEVNRNSGAESTIEALLTLLELEAYPEAVRYAGFTRVRSDGLQAEFAGPSGERLTLRLEPQEGRFVLE